MYVCVCGPALAGSGRQWPHGRRAEASSSSAPSASEPSSRDSEGRSECMYVCILYVCMYVCMYVYCMLGRKFRSRLYSHHGAITYLEENYYIHTYIYTHGYIHTYIHPLLLTDPPALYVLWKVFSPVPQWDKSCSMYPMTMKARDPTTFKRNFRTKYRMIPESTTVPAKVPFGTMGSNDSR